MPEMSTNTIVKPAAVSPERFLPMPDERWRVCRNVGCREQDKIDLQNGRLSLGLWLQRVKSDRMKMFEIRGVLGQGFLPWPLAQLSDDSVMQLVTDLLEAGRLHLHAPPAAALADVAWDEETAGDDDSYTPSSSYSPPVGEPSTFGPDADAAAQAAALAAAAASGIPFCEQCAAAAKAARSPQSSDSEQPADSQ
jgi:hypothetical protein